MSANPFDSSTNCTSQIALLSENRRSAVTPRHLPVQVKQTQTNWNGWESDLGVLGTVQLCR
ncbi:hypothetical protein M404DRAFT_995428 [Pisolithus tinctorius Marx 270]|uniref:Uncharacterized protein n=1 Tax=Pisolithus tinctorius Marx 270 TaxID=870435 RepID=A0A0C3P9L0_PISTI|nr:hypothetical protein M404DRAFT_995428 [Pisolithus tinctorius Marx 270]